MQSKGTFVQKAKQKEHLLQDEKEHHRTLPSAVTYSRGTQENSRSTILFQMRLRSRIFPRSVCLSVYLSVYVYLKFGCPFPSLPVSLLSAPSLYQPQYHSPHNLHPPNHPPDHHTMGQNQVILRHQKFTSPGARE